VEEVLDIAEDTTDTLKRADDAEMRVVDNMRKMGAALLHEWAVHQEKRQQSAGKRNTQKLKGTGKKSPLGNHTWPVRTDCTTFFGWPEISSSFFLLG
jgi:hypothetical protein